MWLEVRGGGGGGGSAGKVEPIDEFTALERRLLEKSFFEIRVLSSMLLFSGVLVWSVVDDE